MNRNFCLTNLIPQWFRAYRLLAALILVPAAASAQAAVDLVSRGAPGLTANGASGSESELEMFASADGRFVVYASYATDLAVGLVDRNSERDVFLLDRSLDTTTLVSRSAGSAIASANGASVPAAISADGRFVVYQSDATDVVADVFDGNGQPDIFLFDRVSESTTLVTRSALTPMTTANGPTYAWAISADGGSLLLLSRASDLVNGSDTNGGNDTFLYEREAGTIELVSHAADSSTTAANGGSLPVALSADGRWALFHTTSTNLVAGISDGNATSDVYVYDANSGSNRLVSSASASATATANGSAAAKAISADGRFLTYQSNATNVVAGVADANGGEDVYVYDRVQGTSVLVSRTAALATTTANGRSYAEKISADGRWVLYSTEATNVAAGVIDTGNGFDAYLHDLQTGATILVTRSFDGPNVAVNGGGMVALSGDGGHVLWHSSSPFVISGIVDTNFNQDAFLFDRQSSSNHLLSRSVLTPNSTANAGSRPTWLSSDGRYALYGSNASDLLPAGADRNADRDVYVYDGEVSGSLLVSQRRATLPTTANGAPGAPLASQSSDGRWVLYSSTATNVLEGQVDENGGSDVFLHDTVNDFTLLISHAGTSALSTGNASSGAVALSADGRWALFESQATNILTGTIDTNNATDVYLFDRDSGVTTLITHAASSLAIAANRASTATALTPDGHWVLFASQATNLIAGIIDGSIQDVFLYEVPTASTSLISHSAASVMTPASAHSNPVAITPDGLFVAFTSYATNLVDGQIDANAALDTFLYDRSKGISMLASRSAASAFQTADDASNAIAISDDGRWLAFGSNAGDHLAGVTDSNAASDTFLYDRDTQSLQLVSASVLPGTTGNGASFPVALSADGRRVLFNSRATDLVDGMVDNNFDAYDAFAFDRFDGSRTLISHAAGLPLQTANRQSLLKGITADGLRASFTSEASDLIAGLTDTNFAEDVFVHDLAGSATQLISHAAGTPLVAANRGATGGLFIADGRKLLLASRSGDLDPGSLDGNIRHDLYQATLPPETALFEDGFE